MYCIHTYIYTLYMTYIHVMCKYVYSIEEIDDFCEFCLSLYSTCKTYANTKQMSETISKKKNPK